MLRTLNICIRTIAAAALLLSLSRVCTAGKPLPPEDQLAAATRLIIDTFRSELSAADKTPAVKAMLETAAKTEGDDAAQAALYLSAADVASRAGATKLAFEALDQLSRTFDVDLLSVKLTSLDAAAKNAKTTDARVSLANRSLELAADAAQAGRFDVADAALKTAAAASSKVKDADLRKDVAANRKKVEKARRQHEQAETALASAKKALKELPDDAEANETLGKYLAFEKNDWSAALKHFAKSADSALQRAAAMDQAGATEPAKTAALGDVWWSLGDRADPPKADRDKAGYKSRAVFWYTRSLNGLSGFAKARIEKRLKDVGEEALAAAADQTGGENGKFIDITLAPGVLMRLVKIPASADGKVKSFYLGQTEVTTAQWRALLGEPKVGAEPNIPVRGLEFKDTKSFITALNGSRFGARLAFRLPTGDEYYHAAKADGKLSQQASVSWLKENKKDMTIANVVASSKPNAFDVYDMIGNAWEWINDERKPRCMGGSYYHSLKDYATETLPEGYDETLVPGQEFSMRVAADLR